MFINNQDRTSGYGIATRAVAISLAAVFRGFLLGFMLVFESPHQVYYSRAVGAEI